MERYIENRQLSDKKSQPYPQFYNARNYQYAWFSSTWLTEQARFFWNQYDYAVSQLKDSSIADNTFYKKADSYINQEKVSVSTRDTNLLNTEFGFTEHFIRYVNSTYEKGYVKKKDGKIYSHPENVPNDHGWFIAEQKHKDEKYYEDVNTLYAALKTTGLYYDIAKPADGQRYLLSKRRWRKMRWMMPFLYQKDYSSQVKCPVVTAAALSLIHWKQPKSFQKKFGYKTNRYHHSRPGKDMNVPR